MTSKSPIENNSIKIQNQVHSLIKQIMKNNKMALAYWPCDETYNRTDTNTCTIGISRQSLATN